MTECREGLQALVDAGQREPGVRRTGDVETAFSNELGLPLAVPVSKMPLDQCLVLLDDQVRQEAREPSVGEQLLPAIGRGRVRGEDFDDEAGFVFKVRVFGFGTTGDHRVGIIERAVGSWHLHVALVDPAETTSRGLPERGEDIAGDPAVPAADPDHCVDVPADVLVLDRRVPLELQVLLDAHKPMRCHSFSHATSIARRIRTKKGG